MNKLLRMMLVVCSSFLGFLVFLAASGIVRVQGAEISSRTGILGYKEPVSVPVFDSMRERLPEVGNLPSSPAAPAADVDLQVTLSDFPDPVFAGNVLTYTADILNDSLVTATLVTLTDTLPAQVALLDAVPSQGSCTGAVCDLGDLVGGGAASVVLSVLVDPSFSGTLDNQVEVTSSDNELDPGNNTDIEQTIVDMEADLGVIMPDDPDPVIAGNPLTYTVVITNYGPSDANNVTITNDFPPSLSFIASLPGSPTCIRTGTVINCELGDLVAGDSKPVTLRMRVKTGSTNPLSNYTIVETDTTDPNDSNDQVTEETTIIFSSDLSLSKVDDPDPVIPGGTLNYTLTVTNSGPSDADGVILTDTLPLEVSLLEITPSQGTCTGTVCTLETIAAGGNASVNLVTQVNLGTTGVITNSAQVNSLEPDPQLDNNLDVEMTGIDTETDLADLAITKTDFPDPVAPGGLLTYTLNIVNNGPLSATNVIVTDTLPLEVSLLTITSTLGTCDGTTCELGTITAGSNAFVTLITQVDSGATGVIFNSAEVTSPDDTEAGNNFVEVETVIEGTAQADLEISTTGSPNPVAPGGLLTYTLNVLNNGPDSATDVTVTDTLPAQVTFVSSQPGEPICSEGGGVVTCGPWTLEPSETTAVNIIVEVDPYAVGPLVNQAQVASPVFDPDTSNNQATEFTTVTASADLAVSTVDFPEPADPGGILTYTLTVTNNGPFVTGGVTLIDTLPDEVTLLDADPSQGSCSGPVCSLGIINAGSSAQVTLVGLISVDASGVITNTAQVFGQLIDPIPENDIDYEFTTVGPGADLSLIKTATPDPVVAGEILSYTLSIYNQGPSDAPGIALVDILPGNVIFLASMPGAPACAHAAGTVTCNLGTVASGETRDVNLLVLVDASATGSLSNQAQVSSTTFDPEEANNQAEVITQIETSADLALGIDDNPDPVSPGAELLYTIDLVNFGPSVSQDLELAVQLPISVTVLNVMPGPPTCIYDESTLVCSLSALSAGAGIEVSLNVLVDSNANGTLALQAVLSSSTPDPDGANNSTMEETTVLIPDIIPPTVEWIYPVGNEQTYYVGTEILLLEVDATDNVAVERVDFFWWDPEIEQFIDISSAFDAPYSVEFDTSVLYDGYNQVYVRAYDTSGNASNRPRILLYHKDLLFLPVIAR